MTYGITCVNGSNELTISSDGYLFGYIGKATFSSVVAASGDANASQAGYAIYVINWPGKLIAALGLRTASSAGQRIIRVYRLSSSQWAIHIRDCSPTIEGPSGGASYFANYTNADVYCWGVPTSVSGFGVALYNSAGLLSADMSRTPLKPKERVSYAAGVLTATVGTYVKAAVIGSPRVYHNLSTVVTGHGGTPWHNTSYEGLWSLRGTTLTRNDVLDTDEYDDGGVPEHDVSSATTCTLIEANGLT